MTHPFGVGDFISIQRDISGEVIEISMNYAKNLGRSKEDN